MRRRLLLERAAWQLSRTGQSVTDIAFDAAFGSLEAFTRAFRRAFGVSPSIYRRMGATDHRLAAPSGIHYASPSKGASDMDLFDRLAGHDSWHTGQLLDMAKKLTGDQLDRPIRGAKLIPWEEPDGTLREMLERLVSWKEIWTAALAGGPMPNETDRSIAGLCRRFQKTDGEFQKILREVRDRGGWDDTFVDALCEPAETFTFGGVFAHVITFNSYRRLSALAVFRDLGVEGGGMGCPTEYEAAVAPWR